MVLKLMKIFMVGLVGELTEQNWPIIRVILCTTSSDQDERVLTILNFVFVIVVPISKTEKSSYFSNHFFNSSLDQTGNWYGIFTARKMLQRFLSLFKPKLHFYHTNEESLVSLVGELFLFIARCWGCMVCLQVEMA